MAREYTNTILEMVKEGHFDKDQLILEILNWMSESEVRQMAETLGWTDEEEVEEDLDDSDRFETCSYAEDF
jgi:hypothetical protein